MLHYRTVGEGRPLVIVHGLFGSGDNWQTLAAKFPGYRVVLPDLRNHGSSPWSDEFKITDLAADLGELADGLGLGPCPWVGHSLGGKAVAELALSSPDRVTGIAVLDIAPRQSEPHYPGFVPALLGLDLAALTSRSDAQAKLEAAITDRPTLLFLLKSLVSDPGAPHGWRWKLNLASLEKNYAEIWKPVALGRVWDGPALFLYGGASDYVRIGDDANPGDEVLIRQLCPRAEFVEVAGAGHWLHAEKPVEVVGALNAWLGRLP
jgi:esterase